MRTYLFGLHWHPMIIYILENAFEQWVESLLCDEYFLNEDMLAGPWIPMVVMWFLLVPICIILKNILTEL